MNPHHMHVFNLVADVSDDACSDSEKLSFLNEMTQVEHTAFNESLIEYFKTLENLRDDLAGLADRVEKLTAPPYPVATYLRCVPTLPNFAEVNLNGKTCAIQIDSRLDGETLERGDQVYLSETENIILYKAEPQLALGGTGTVKELFEDGRVLLATETNESIVFYKAANCVALDEGDTVIIDISSQLVRDRIQRPDIKGVDTLFHFETEKPVPFIGSDEAQAERTRFINVHRNPERARRFEVESAGLHLLLSGPSGAGKTLFARNLADDLGLAMYVVSGSSFYSMWVGKTEENIRDFFKQVKKNAPAMLFIDEIDAIGHQRGSEGQNHSDRFLNQLLAELDGAKGTPGFVIVAATNRLDILDPALTQRFSLFDIGRPNRDAIAQIINVHLSTEIPWQCGNTRADVVNAVQNHLTCPNVDNDIAEVAYSDGSKAIVKASDMISGRLIKQIVERGKLRAFNRAVATDQEVVIESDFVMAAEDVIDSWRGLLSSRNVRDYVAGLRQDINIVALNKIERKTSFDYIEVSHAST